MEKHEYISRKFDTEAILVSSKIPAGNRVAVIGSTSFWHGDSEQTCIEIGRCLANLDNLVLLTGGVPGVGECIGRSFAEGCRKRTKTPNVIHILPRGFNAWDYGLTIFAGDDLSERREILGRLAKIYIVVEGGPGTEHEARIASAHGATLVPVGRSGGHAGDLYASVVLSADALSWKVLGDSTATPRTVATAVLAIVDHYIRQGV